MNTTYEKKNNDSTISYSQKPSLLPNEKPERLSLKDKLEKSRKFMSSPSKN